MVSLRPPPPPPPLNPYIGRITSSSSSRIPAQNQVVSHRIPSSRPAKAVEERRR
uniref:Uncharacterized protein n=1 Tax=Arundo donax TaxID=35708 RepID=A0A0A9F3W0_ARUDO